MKSYVEGSWRVWKTPWLARLHCARSCRGAVESREAYFWTWDKANIHLVHMCHDRAHWDMHTANAKRMLGEMSSESREEEDSPSPSRTAPHPGLNIHSVSSVQYLYVDFVAETEVSYE